MDRVRWNLVDTLFHQAVERTGAERERWLRELGGEDPDLRDQIERLLRFDDEERSFIDVPRLELEAHPLTEGVARVCPLGYGLAIGGHEFLTINFATLWGDTENTLTVLDANFCDDNFWSLADNGRFATNIARWLSEVTRQSCPDIDGDGMVGLSDLLAVLAEWGPCPPECVADLDGDGDVDFEDLLLLLAAWGPCPFGALSEP